MNPLFNEDKLKFVSARLDKSEMQIYAVKILNLSIVRITSLELLPVAVQYNGHVILTETCDNDSLSSIDKGFLGTVVNLTCLSINSGFTLNHVPSPFKLSSVCGVYTNLLGFSAPCIM